MECLEGETLAARLQRGPLEVGEALRHAIGIADALDKAHRAGVVHRDLKPGNIMLTRSGAKLLDFGVAKLRPAGAIAATTATVTASPPLTGRGTIVGTLQYMAPEQVEGKEADARSDLFAFGAVLYEMVTGRKAFQGSSPASLIAAIMSAEPPVAEMAQPSTARPRASRQDVFGEGSADRRQTAHDVLLQLGWIAGNQTNVTSPSRRAWRPGWKWVATAIVVLSGSVGDDVVFHGERAVTPADAGLDRATRKRTDRKFPGDFAGWDTSRVQRSRGRGEHDAVDSHTGLLDVGLDQGNGRRARSVLVARQPLHRLLRPGQDEDRCGGPGVVSPPVQTLAEAPDARGGAWGRDGVIVFARNIEDGLYRVTASGGDVTPVTTLDRSKRENSHRWPQFLPDGRHLLFLARSAASEHQGIYTA